MDQLRTQIGSLSRSGAIAGSTAKQLQQTLAVAASAPTAAERRTQLEALQAQVGSAKPGKIDDAAKAALLDLIAQALR